MTHEAWHHSHLVAYEIMHWCLRRCINILFINKNNANTRFTWVWDLWWLNIEHNTLDVAVLKEEHNHNAHNMEAIMQS